jgi:cwf21 domain
MSSNVGLTTPRGSGTSGYIQRNLSTLKPRTTGYGAPYPPLGSPSNSSSLLHPSQRQPDQAILAHDRQREVEIKVFTLRDELEEGGKVDEEEIERRCDELRRKLLLEDDDDIVDGDGGRGGGKGGRGGKALKPHQVHELAEAKIKESERLRRALGISEGREGKAWEDGRRGGSGGGGGGGGGKGYEEWGDRDRERGREKEWDVPRASKR